MPCLICAAYLGQGGGPGICVPVRRPACCGCLQSGHAVEAAAPDGLLGDQGAPAVHRKSRHRVDAWERSELSGSISRRQLPSCGGRRTRMRSSEFRYKPQVKRAFTTFVVMLFLIGMIGHTPAAGHGNAARGTLAVALPRFTIGPRETIAGIEYQLKAATIVGVNNVRSCWDIHIRNGEELRSELIGQALFLSAGIGQRDLSSIDDFISIRENEPEPGAHLFDVKVTLTITDDRWEKTRYMTLSKAQLALIPIENRARAPQQRLGDSFSR